MANFIILKHILVTAFTYPDNLTNDLIDDGSSPFFILDAFRLTGIDNPVSFRKKTRNFLKAKQQNQS